MLSEGPKLESPGTNRGMVWLVIGAFVGALVVGTASILAYQAIAERADRSAYLGELAASGSADTTVVAEPTGQNGSHTKGPTGPVAPSEEQVLWAWAACAILTESNGTDHDIFGGCEPGTPSAARTVAGLEQWWGVTDRQTLLDTLAWLESEGHRASFQDVGSLVSEASPKELADIRASVESRPEEANQVEVALEYYEELGARSILGWDYSRYVMLCGWGHVAGYLTEEEALEMAIPAARLLQDTFDSWADLGENYLIGRQFWSLAQTIDAGAELQRTYEHLLSDGDSPWRQIPWDLDLD